MMLKEYKLKQLGQIITGSTPPTSTEEYFNGDIPFIKPSDLIDGEKYPPVTETTLSQKGADYLGNRNLLPKGSVAVVTIGTIGKLCYISENSYTNQQINALIPDTEICDSEFLFYLMIAHIPSVKVLNGGSASGRENVNKSSFSNIKVNLPPLPTQKKIASILSAYDDLIKNNTQRIKILEEMAEEIYKEWFVRMRFPGWQDAVWKDADDNVVERGSDGGLPEGWEEKRIGEAFEILGGGTPSTINEKFWINGDINWYSPTDLTSEKLFFQQSSSKKITKLGLKGSSAKLFPKNCVMMTSRATIGAIGINKTIACTNQGFITCIPNENYSKEFIFLWIKMNKSLIEQYASGATFKEISKSQFKKFKILFPEKTCRSGFTETVFSMFEEINILEKKNKVLQETRDLLLPRLISGKLDVRRMDV